MSSITNVMSNKWTIIALRLILGGIFIAASIGKLHNQTEFINIVISYELLPHGLANAYGLVVPWVELFIGCSLILSTFATLAAGLAIPLTISFITANAWALSHQFSDECGCFGQLFPMSYSISLIIDVLMLVMATVLILFIGKSVGLNIFHFKFAPRFKYIYKTCLIAIIVLAIGLPLHNSATDNSICAQIDSNLREGKPVFLSFSLEGCADCEVQKPVVEVVNRDYGTEVAFIFIDYRAQPQAASCFGVYHVPTMLLITAKDSTGQYVIYERFDSLADEKTLRACIDGALML